MLWSPLKNCSVEKTKFVGQGIASAQRGNTGGNRPNDFGKVNHIIPIQEKRRGQSTPSEKRCWPQRCNQCGDHGVYVVVEMVMLTAMSVYPELDADTEYELCVVVPDVIDGVSAVNEGAVLVE